MLCGDLKTASRVRWSVTVASAMMSAGSFAQAPEPASKPSSALALEEVVVTATKRQADPQDVPISITAISNAVLEERGITSVDGIGGLAPNLDVYPSSLYANGIAVFIRGIGGFDAIGAPEYPIAIYENDVPIFRQNSALVDLVDLERVEVLRGPQGTLFGRNTTGGAVSIYTKRPDTDFSLEQKLGVGNFGSFTSRTVLDTGNWGSSSIRATLAYSHKARDGYVRNTRTTSSNSPGALDSDAFYLAIDGEPTEALQIQYTGEYSQSNSVTPYQQLAIVNEPLTTILAQSPSFGGDAIIIGRDRIDSVALPFPEANRNEVMSHGLKFTFDASENFTLKTIFGYREFDEVNHADWTGQGDVRGQTADGVQFIPLFFARNLTPRGRTYTGEVQAVGSAGPFNYVVGTFYLDDVYKQGAVDFDFTLGRDPATGVISLASVDQEFKQETTSKAAYADLSFRPDGSDFEISGGLRYTEDEKYQELPSTFNGADTSPVPKSDSWDNLSGTVRLKYDWSQQFNTYLSYSTAFRSGGFSGATILPFEPELASTYEVGFKSNLLDNRVLLNAAAFLTDYEDLQITQFVASVPGLITTNAGEATYKGVDLELQARLTQEWSANVNVGYVDAEYDTFLFTTAAGVTTNVADQAKFPGLSKLTVGASVGYESDAIFARLNYTQRSSQYFQALTQLFPLRDQLKADGSQSLGARLTFKKLPFVKSDSIELELWGENLTDDDRQIGGTDFGTFGTVVYGVPRTFGANVTVKL